MALSGALAGADLEHMFAADEIVIEVPVEVAIARLTDLISRGALHAPCEAAFEGGLAAVVLGGDRRGR